MDDDTEALRREARRIHIADQAQAATDDRNRMLSKVPGTSHGPVNDPIAKNLLDIAMKEWTDAGRKVCQHCAKSPVPMFLWFRAPIAVVCGQCSHDVSELGSPRYNDDSYCDHCHTVAPVEPTIITQGPFTLIAFCCADCRHETHPVPA